MEKKQELYAAGYLDGVYDVNQLEKTANGCFTGIIHNQGWGYYTFYVGTNDECSYACDVMEVLLSNDDCGAAKWCENSELSHRAYIHILDAAIVMLKRYKEATADILSEYRQAGHEGMEFVEIAADIVDKIYRKREEQDKASKELREHLRRTEHRRGIRNNLSPAEAKGLPLPVE